MVNTDRLECYSVAYLADNAALTTAWNQHLNVSLTQGRQLKRSLCASLGHLGQETSVPGDL